MAKKKRRRKRRSDNKDSLPDQGQMMSMGGGSGGGPPLSQFFDKDEVTPEDVNMEGPVDEMDDIDQLQFRVRRRFYFWRQLINANLQKKMMMQFIEGEEPEEQEQGIISFDD